MSANAATDFAVALLGELIRRGVRDFVVCPGSRSQALALAAAAYEQTGQIRLRVRIDERVAGFLALGIAVETGAPVVIITTSGTAVANLHPAVLEAHHSAVPLIMLTADRPAELRGIGSNQTTEQVGLFGSAVGWLRDVEAPGSAGTRQHFDPEYPEQLAHEAYSAAAGHSSPAGPVQLNLAFREPLSGPVGELTQLQAHQWPSGHPRETYSFEVAPHTIVIAGAGAGPEAESFARALGVPLIAEVSSGARFGPNLVVAYRELLDDADFGGLVRRAVVFGHPTLSRQIPALLTREDVETHIVRGDSFEAYNPGHRASSISQAASAARMDNSAEGRAWVGQWVHTGRRLAATTVSVDGEVKSASEPVVASSDRSESLAREQLAVFRQPVSRRLLVDALWRVSWPHDRLVLGASRLIREADSVVPGKKISVHANRGLAGIDGTIATAIGIALASQDTDTVSGAGITRVLVGDLTALYDVGALLFGAGEERPRIQVIVGNDGGGTIFDSLEVSKSAQRQPFDRVQYTPQCVDFRALAAAYGWDYRLAGNRGELDEALAASALPTLVEVPLPR